MATDRGTSPACVHLLLGTATTANVHPLALALSAWDLVRLSCPVGPVLAHHYPPPPCAVKGRPRSRARTLRSPVCTPRARATVPKVYRYSPCLEEHLYVPSHPLCSPPLVVEDAVCVRVHLRVAGLHPGLRGLASILNVTGFRAHPPSQSLEPSGNPGILRSCDPADHCPAVPSGLLRVRSDRSHQSFASITTISLEVVSPSIPLLDWHRRLV